MGCRGIIAHSAVRMQLDVIARAWIVIRKKFYLVTEAGARVHYKAYLTDSPNYRGKEIRTSLPSFGEQVLPYIVNASEYWLVLRTSVLSVATKQIC